jgi:hypothetical protein
MNIALDLQQLFVDTSLRWLMFPAVDISRYARIIWAKKVCGGRWSHADIVTGGHILPDGRRKEREVTDG